MSNISIGFDQLLGWRNSVRAVCVICLSFAGFMFCVPEPERNATNKEEAELKFDEQAKFIHLEKEISHDDPIDSKPLLTRDK